MADSSRQADSSGQAGERGGRPRTPIWARPDPGRRRSTLTREAIVKAALEIADTEGLAAVSIRRVAAALGARTMSLYTYIDSKDDLLDLMSNEVAGEVVIEGELPAGWREAITVISRREWEVALRHPWLVDLMNSHVRGAVGPNGLRHLEQSLAALSGLGVSTFDAWQIIGAIDGYMLGCVARQVREIDAARDRGVEVTDGEALTQPYLQQLIESGDFINIQSLLEDGIPDIGSNFELGLSWMLDGVERTYARHAESAPANGGAPHTAS